MIRYLSDWKKYPQAIVHTSTKNKSFLRHAGLLKAMGVKNHAFMLALLNPELENIDPHDENLTPEQMQAIVIECKNNPWYIFREVIKIPANGSSRPVPLEANRGNISLYWLFFNHITSLLIQPRQTGKSVSVDSLMIALINIICYKTNVHLFTKDDGLRSKNIERLKNVQSELPFYLNLKTRGDANNTEAMTVKLLENNYVTSLPQSSKKDALKVGRGYTVAIHHVDEIAYINNIDISLPALLTSSNAAIDNAKANDAPYGFVFTTTAGYLTTTSGKYVKEKIYDASLRWTEHLYDCKDEADLVKTIKKNNPHGKLMILLEFSHRQLGKTDEWLIEKIEAALSEGEDAEADYLNKWATGNAESAIDKKYLDRIVASQVLDPYVEFSEEGYLTKWYVSKHEVLTGLKDRHLVMGLDTSEANSGDDISMKIRDAASGELVAAGSYNELNTITFSEWIAKWLIKYPNLTLIIEKRSTGSTMIENILLILPKYNIDPFRRIFNWVVDEQHVNNDFKEALNTPLHRRDMKFYDRYKKYFGYATAGSGKQSRSTLYGKVFNSSLHYTSNTVRDSTLIHQLTMLKKENNRIDHAPGEHDDSVIAWLLAYWFLMEAKNKAYYGLDIRHVLSIVNIIDVTDQGGEEALKIRHNNMVVRREISKLEDEYKKATSDFERIRLDHKIKHYAKYIVNEPTVRINQDVLIEEAKSYMKYTTNKPYKNLYDVETSILAS